MTLYATLESERDGPVALVRLKRPEKLNAISPEMVDELAAAVAEVSARDEVRAVVFTGAGRAFSAGADVAHLVSLSSSAELLAFLERMGRAYDAIAALDRPTIAAVNGIAYGGGLELALACDLRVASEQAKLGVPEIHLGVLPGAGGTQRLARMLPAAVAKEMIFFGKPLGAEAAFHHGLVNAVVEPDELLDVALDWARRLAALPPLALAAAKRLVATAEGADLASGADAERRTVAFLRGTEDAKEGMRAFLEKRAPRFTGR